MLHFPSISEDEFQEGCQAFSRCAAEEAKSITSSGLIVDIVSGALTIEKEYSLTTHDDDNNKNENDYDDVKEEATSTAEATETTETAREELDGLTDDDDHEVRPMLVPFLVRALTSVVKGDRNALNLSCGAKSPRSVLGSAVRHV